MDMRASIAPKSDQLNYDDFLATGPITVKITNVTGSADPQQPIAINYEGDNGKPYKPCKSMRRVMVAVWGMDGKKYIGKSMTLYGDPKVVFGGMAVGGIRISHMSDITEPKTMPLSVSKANKKPYTVEPLVAAVKVKPELNPDYKGWEGAKKALAEGTYTIEKLREIFVISEANEELLKPKPTTNTDPDTLFPDEITQTA